MRVEFLSLRFTPNKKDDYRLAVVVSKKVSKSAVTRNRIRRRLYEAVRVAKQSTEKPWHYDISLTVYDERLATLPSSEITSAVVKLLEKSGIIKR